MDKTLKSKIKSKKINNNKYCCLDTKIKNKCLKINNLSLTEPEKYKKYAIATLLINGDTNLAGVLLLCSSIKNVMPKSYEKYITFICIITNDVSVNARIALKKIYDKIIEVEYIKIPQYLIKHNFDTIKYEYSINLTKFRIFEMTEYDKILFLDSNNLVLKKEIFSLFNLKTPATIFLGNISNKSKSEYYRNFYENGNLFKEFQKKYCNWNKKTLHGNLIPYHNNYKVNKTKKNDKSYDKGNNINLSILLIEPNKNIAVQIKKYIDNIIKNKIKINGDNDIINYIFKEKIYAIEPRFFAKWINPIKNPEVIVLNLFDNKGSPWNINIFKDIIEYSNIDDIKYWWNYYIKTYKNEYIKYNNNILDNLYNTIIDIDKIKNIYKTNINIDIGNYLSAYFHKLGLSILNKKDFKYENKNIDFIKNLPSFIKYKYDKILNDFKYKGINLQYLLNKKPEELWFIIENKQYLFWICMKEIINKILDESLQKSNLKKEVEYPVIHFRCADTPFLRYKEYHFQKYKFYKEILDKISIQTNKKYKKIIILSCSFHRSDNANQKACLEYTTSLSDYIQSLGYETIIECKKNIEDFATLFYAPAVISNGSSFSFMSGMFGKGLFYSGQLEENDLKPKCTMCNKWLSYSHTLKHKDVDDYYDTKKVISILQS